MTILAALTYHILHRHETTKTLASHAMQRPSETSMAFSDYDYKQSEASRPCPRSCRPNFGIRPCCQSHRPRNMSRRYIGRKTLDRLVSRWPLGMAVIDNLCAPPPFWPLARLPRDERPPRALELRSIQNLYYCQVPSAENSSMESPTLELCGAEEAAETSLLAGSPPSSSCLRRPVR